MIFRLSPARPKAAYFQSRGPGASCRFMSIPLLSDRLAAQQTDPKSALAAAFIIANRHPEI